MMNALPQTATPAGLPPFLAALNPAGSAMGDAGGFDRLVAAAPMPATTAPTAAAPDMPLPGEMPLPSLGAAPDAAPEAAPAAPDAPTAVSADPAATAGQLIALAGRITATVRPGDASATPPATDAANATDGDAEPVPADPAEATDPAAWTPIVPAAAATSAASIGRTAATREAATAKGEPAAAAHGKAVAIAARTHDSGTPLPGTAAIEAPTPKAATADGGAAMTILFTQPATHGAAVADVARPAILAERTLDMTSDDQWIAQLATDIAATKSQDGDLSFRLMPRHLGRLDVAMQLGDDGVSLKMETQHEATATIVTAAQGRLVEDLRQQGVRVAGAEVTCAPDQPGRQSQGQGQGRGPAHDPAHLIETATAERPAPRDERSAAERRGRFA